MNNDLVVNNLNNSNQILDVNEQRFIDINIDSENESTSEFNSTCGTSSINNPSHNNTTNNNNNTNSNNATIKSKDDKKFLFNFRKTSKQKNALKQMYSDPQMSVLNVSNSAPLGSANHLFSINNSNNSQIITYNSKTLPQLLPAPSLTLTEAADILFSNLNEIDLSSYSDDFDEDEDEDDEDKVIKSNDKSLYNLQSKVNKSKNSDNSKIKDKKERFLNSTLVCSNPTSSCENIDSNENEEIDQSKIELNDHSTPLPSNEFSPIENLKIEKLCNSLNSSISTDNNDQTISCLDEEVSNSQSNNSNNEKSAKNLKNDNELKNKTLTDNNNNRRNLSNQNEFLAKAHQRNIQNYLNRNDSIVDGLLGDIYDRFNISFKESFDSDVFTEMSISSSRFSGGDSTADHESESKHYSKNNKMVKSNLEILNIQELQALVNELNTKVNQMSAKLIRQLKQKDKFASKLNRNCDILTALLQARSLKRRVDTQMKFTLNPVPGETGFIQWKDAMKALARLPGGVPKEFRKSVWLNLSQKYIRDINLDWNRVRRIAFNDRSNPDDDELGIQIVKDLHRTGCSAFSGQDNEQDRALLKRVLLAFARYNKSVGYCQGFNIIAALILEIVDKKEEDALMCMIYLIDHILPEGYFTNSMHSLAIDMAVFRELLRTRLPKLCEHLNALQFNSTSASSSSSNKKVLPTLPSSLNKQKKNSLQSSSSSSLSESSKLASTYEPPLTNVFTMQWFLTLFATCLPKNVLLRVWDSIFLEGAEILFRTSIAIWDKLSVSVLKANSADAFYSMMSVLTIRLFDQNTIDENDLINKIYSYGPFPLTGLEEFREKFTFNIKPFQVCLQNNSSQNSNGKSKSKNENSNKNGLSSLKLNDKSKEIFVNTSDSLIPIDDSNSKNKSDSTDKNRTDELTLRKIGDEYDDDRTLNGDDDDEVEDLAKMISCFALIMPNRSNSSISNSSSRNDIMMAAAAAASAYSQKSIKANSLFSKTFSKNQNEKSQTDNKKTKNAISRSSQSKNSNGMKENELPNSKENYLDKINENIIENNHDISTVTPGAFSYVTQMYNPKPLEDHLTLDLNELKKQYKKLKERQQQAHVIIRTASTQHWLKNSNTSTAGSPSSSCSSIPNPLMQSHLALSRRSSLFGSNKSTNTSDYLNRHHMVTKSLSASTSISIEPTHVVNHLLIKTNDPQCNTLKKPIQLNTGSSSIMITDSSYDPFSTIIKSDLQKNFNSLNDEILKYIKDKSNKKKSAAYYSDDDDDDENDEELESDENIRPNDLNNNLIDSNNNNLSELRGNSKALSSQSDNTVISKPNLINIDIEQPKLDIDQAKSLSLIDLANLNRTDLNPNKNASLNCNQDILGQSKESEKNQKQLPDTIRPLSSFDSPLFLESKNIIHTNKIEDSFKENDIFKLNQENEDLSIFNLNSNINSKTKVTAKSADSSVVIKHLANEEKRNMSPLNPFPTRHINLNVAKNGIRLGLYK